MYTQPAMPFHKSLSVVVVYVHTVGPLIFGKGVCVSWPATATETSLLLPQVFLFRNKL